MINGIDDALEFIKQAEKFEKEKFGYREMPTSVVNPDKDEEGKGQPVGQPTQYALHGPGYLPTTTTVPVLPAGCFDIASDNHGIFAIPAPPPAGLLLELPEMRSEHVLSLMETFWESESDYKDGNEFVIGGAAFKAGMMLYGPPGSGKSSTIKLANKKLIERGGTVFYASLHPQGVSTFLNAFNRIEPNRKCIVILEDFDSLIDHYGEAGYLEMLDSAKSIDNVLFIATTNYPDRLDPRVYNRPGRFSHVIKIGLPGELAREAYLKAILKNHRDVAYIVENSKGFTIDHLTSLVNGVYREKKELKTEIARLRTLFSVPKSDNENSIGFSE